MVRINVGAGMHSLGTMWQAQSYECSVSLVIHSTRVIGCW